MQSIKVANTCIRKEDPSLLTFSLGLNFVEAGPIANRVNSTPIETVPLCSMSPSDVTYKLLHHQLSKLYSPVEK